MKPEDTAMRIARALVRANAKFKKARPCGVFTICDAAECIRRVLDGDTKKSAVRTFPPSKYKTRNSGETHGNAKLTPCDVRAIRTRMTGRVPRQGELIKSIASEFGVTIQCICNIAAGRRWKHIT